MTDHPDPRRQPEPGTRPDRRRVGPPARDPRHGPRRGGSRLRRPQAAGTPARRRRHPLPGRRRPPGARRPGLGSATRWRWPTGAACSPAWSRRCSTRRRRRARHARRRRGAAAARCARGQGRDRLDEPRRSRRRQRGRWTTGSPATTPPASPGSASRAARCCCASTTRTPPPPPTIEGCAVAVSELAELGLMAMVEPLPYHREEDGSLTLRKDAPSLARAITIASGLGTTSAYTWLKMPSCDDPETVFGATTLPCVVLGGVPEPGPGRGPRVVGPGPDAAGGARPRRGPGAALPARRRRARGRRAPPRPCSATAHRGRLMRLHRPAGTAAGAEGRVVAPHPGRRRLGLDRDLRCSRSRPAASTTVRTGGVRGVRAAARRRRSRSRSARRGRPAAGVVRPHRPRQRLRRRHRLRLRRPRQRRGAHR